MVSAGAKPPEGMIKSRAQRRAGPTGCGYGQSPPRQPRTWTTRPVISTGMAGAWKAPGRTCPLRTPGDQPGEDCRPGLLESQQNGTGEGAVVGPLRDGGGGNVLRPVHDELQENKASGGDGAKITGSGTWVARPIAGLGDPRQVFGKLRRGGPFARFHSGSGDSQCSITMAFNCLEECPPLHVITSPCHISLVSG